MIFSSILPFHFFFNISKEKNGSVQGLHLPDLSYQMAATECGAGKRCTTDNIKQSSHHIDTIVPGILRVQIRVRCSKLTRKGGFGNAYYFCFSIEFI